MKSYSHRLKDNDTRKLNIHISQQTLYIRVFLGKPGKDLQCFLIFFLGAIEVVTTLGPAACDVAVKFRGGGVPSLGLIEVVVVVSFSNRTMR